MKKATNNIKSAQRAKRAAKIRVSLMTTLLTLATLFCTGITAFADNAENSAPTGTGGTNTMTSLVNIVFWIVRVAILIIGGAPALIKIVQGQNDENPRDRNAGIATLVITGAAFAATFVIQNLI